MLPKRVWTSFMNEVLNEFCDLAKVLENNSGVGVK